MVLFCHAPPSLLAQAADYLGDTHVYDTPAKGELEPEYWFDYGRRRDVSKDFTRHWAMLEYGITERWMAELRGQFGRESGESLRFEKGELETRWRLGEKGAAFLDAASFLELEIEHEEDEDELAIEPGLIISRDFGRLNLTANLSYEVPFESGSGSFHSALAAGWRLSRIIRLAGEYRHNWREDRISLIPQFWFIPRENVFVKIGYSFGVAEQKESFLRAALEVEF